MTRGSANVNTESRAPTQKPPFTIGTLRKAIPEHCFKKSMATSFAYLAADLFLVDALFGISKIVNTKAPWWLATIFWPAYWYFQVSTTRQHATIDPLLLYAENIPSQTERYHLGIL